MTDVKFVDLSGIEVEHEEDKEVIREMARRGGVIAYREWPVLAKLKSGRHSVVGCFVMAAMRRQRESPTMGIIIDNLDDAAIGRLRRTFSRNYNPGDTLD